MKEINKFNEIIKHLCLEMNIDENDFNKQKIILEILYLILSSNDFTHFLFDSENKDELAKYWT